MSVTPYSSSNIVSDSIVSDSIVSDSKVISAQWQGWRWLEKPLTGLLLTLAIIACADQLYPVKARGEVLATGSSTRHEAVTAAIAPPSAAQPSLNGTYLYGRSGQPDQIGSTYLVFEVNQDQVVGAFYMPHSSFDCFQGQVQANQLALTVVDSYDQTRYAHRVERQPAAIATQRGAVSHALTLPGYQAIASVSDTDRQLLAVCKAASLPFQ